MPRYEVIRPWNGVQAGQVLELEAMHPALKANVRALKSDTGNLEPATPEATTDKRKPGRPAKGEKTDE
jgi:hypothetical protein